MKRIAQLGLLLAALAWCVPVHATITPKIASAVAFSTTLSTATTVAVDNTGANLLAAVSRCFYDGSNTCLVTDSSGNTWTKGPNITNAGDNIQISISYVCAPTVTSSQTYTITASGARTNVAVMGISYTGATGAAGCNDGTGTSKSTSGTSCLNTSITPAGAGEVFITAATTPVATMTGLSIGSSFTVEGSKVSSLANIGGADLVVAGSGAQAPTWTLTGNSTNGAYCVMIPFLPSAGAATIIGFDKRRRYEQVDE